MRSYDSVYDIEGKRVGLIGSALTSRENIYFERSESNVMLIIVISLGAVCVVITISLIVKKMVFDSKKFQENDIENRSKQYEVKTERETENNS